MVGCHKRSHRTVFSLLFLHFPIPQSQTQQDHRLAGQQPNATKCVAKSKEQREQAEQEMEALPGEVFYVLLEHIGSLNDLGALWLMNRRAAWLCNNIPAKLLWRIAYRTCYTWNCENDDEVLLHNCSVVVPALQEPSSVPFKVRQWLYRRASMRAFGRSKEALSGCIILKKDDLKNPYVPDFSNNFRSRLGIGSSSGWYEEDAFEEEREWDQVWLIFKRHLVMQRVQRVNLGDGQVRPEWSRDGEGGGRRDFFRWSSKTHVACWCGGRQLHLAQKEARKERLEWAEARAEADSYIIL